MVTVEVSYTVTRGTISLLFLSHRLVQFASQKGHSDVVNIIIIKDWSCCGYMSMNVRMIFVVRSVTSHINCYFCSHTGWFNTSINFIACQNGHSDVVNVATI